MSELQCAYCRKEIDIETCLRTPAFSYCSEACRKARERAYDQYVETRTMSERAVKVELIVYGVGETDEECMESAAAKVMDAMHNLLHPSDYSDIEAVEVLED